MAISTRPPAEPLRPGSDRSRVLVRSSSAEGGLGRWLPLAFVIGSSAFVVLALAFALSRSSVFAVRHIEVKGAWHRSVADVVARADVPSGANVVWLDTSAVRDRLLDDPWIARATVTRALPSSIRIAIVERVPIAVVADGRARTMVARDGTRLGPAPGAPSLPMIFLTPSAPSMPLPPSGPATMRRAAEDDAIRAIAAMTPSVRRRVRRVDVAVGGTLILTLRGGTTVDLGPGVDLGAKARMLRRLLAWERVTGTPLGRVSLLAPTAPAALQGP